MSEARSAEADLFEPPDDATVNRAIEGYARAIRAAYGARVKGIYLFGSRARGDHTRESDADIAVVLADDGGEWNYWQETKRLADLSYDLVVETGADLQGWPVRSAEWDDPRSHSNPSLVQAMRHDARAVRAKFLAAAGFVLEPRDHEGRP